MVEAMKFWFAKIVVDVAIIAGIFVLIAIAGFVSLFFQPKGKQ